MTAGSRPTRADLQADVAARRELLTTLKRRSRWSERIGAPAIALAVAAGFRVAWTGGVFARFFGATSWLLTLLVFAISLALARGAIATVAARRLVPARRELAAAESRLRAHDSALGRDD